MPDLTHFQECQPFQNFKFDHLLYAPTLSRHYQKPKVLHCRHWRRAHTVSPTTPETGTRGSGADDGGRGITGPPATRTPRPQPSRLTPSRPGQRDSEAAVAARSALRTSTVTGYLQLDIVGITQLNFKFEVELDAHDNHTSRSSRSPAALHSNLCHVAERMPQSEMGSPAGKPRRPGGGGGRPKKMVKVVRNY